jgi:hypothetical protein
MRPIYALLCTMVAVLCVAPVVSRAIAQEGGSPAAGADAPPAGGNAGDGAAVKSPDGAAVTAEANRDAVYVAPRYGAAGLWRRANVKTLIANAPLSAASTRVGPPSRPGSGVSRNAIGSVMSGTRPAGRDLAGVTAIGTRLPGTATAPGNVGIRTGQLRAPANAGQALRGAGLNGTTMNRAAVIPGHIGGPAKYATGINGTLIKPRY